MQNRIAEILQLQKEDPNDPFFIYALALEYEKTNQLKICVSHLEKLVKDFPNYAGTYLKYAQVLVNVSDEEKAKDILKKGIDLALLLKNYKMKGELQQLLDEIE